MFAQPGGAGTQAQPSQKKGVVFLTLVAEQVDLFQRDLPGVIFLHKEVSALAGQPAMNTEPVGLNHEIRPRREFVCVARENFEITQKMTSAGGRDLRVRVASAQLRDAIPQPAPVVEL